MVQDFNNVDSHFDRYMFGYEVDSFNNARIFRNSNTSEEQKESSQNLNILFVLVSIPRNNNKTNGKAKDAVFFKNNTSVYQYTAQKGKNTRQTGK